MRDLSKTLSLLVAGLLGACFIESGSFTPIGDDDDHDVDGGPDAAGDTDAATGPVRLLVDPTSVDLDEAGTATFTVQLNRAPDAPVLVTLTSTLDDVVSVTPEFVLFGELDWDEPQEVTLYAAEDDDTDDHQATIEVASEDIEESVDVSVAVDDNDVLGIVVSPAGALDVSEDGTATIEVSLSAAPVGSTVVSIDSSAETVATVSTPTMTFTPADWSTPQELTVTGLADLDTTDDTATVTFSSAVTDDELVIVTVVDSDVLGIDPSTTNLGTIVEGAGTSMTIKLTQQPASTVIVTIASDNDALTVSPGTMTFTTSDWDEEQPLSVVAPADVDTADADVEITLSADDLTERTVAAAVDDDDTQAILVEPTSLSLDENQAGSFEVRLAYAPTSPLTMTAASLNGALVGVNAPSLVFDADDYDTPRTIDVLPQDDLDAADGNTAIRLSLLGTGLTTDVPVAVDDDDQLLLETSVTALTVDEDGDGSFGVRLTAQPAATMMVTIISGNQNKVQVTSPLSFTTGNWNDYQDVMLTGVDDNDLADDLVNITVSAGGGPIPNKLVAATVDDDDTQHVMVQTKNVNVAEGSSTEIGVALQFQPAGTVIVEIESLGPSVATAGPETMTFTPGNWSSAQDLTIAGAQDDNIVQDSTSVSVSLAGATGATVNVTVPDNDTLGFVVTAANLTVGENTTGVFNVKLSHQPTTTVNATVAPQTAGIYTVSPGNLTFTPGDWNQNKQVTVTPVSDGDQQDESTNARVTAVGVTEGTCGVTIDDTTQIVNLGWPAYFGATNTYGSGIVHAYKITVSGTPVTLDKWGLVAYNTGTIQVQMAIYSNGASGPGSLIASSGAFNASVGEYDVPDTTVLSAGTYWLVWKASATITIGQSASATPSADYCNKTTTWGAALPTPWGAPTCFSNYYNNIYLVTYR